MTNRYDNRIIFRNDNELYENIIKPRGVDSIRHYGSPYLHYPDQRALRSITQLHHIWAVGDRYYKLAHQYYGSSRYWWVIAQFNQKPTEANIVIGDTVFIPTPLEAALRAFKGG
jgi:hypothetical protein